MIRTNSIFKVLSLLVITVFVGLIVLSGCTDEKEVVKTEIVVEKDTILVNIISVDSIYANPDSITQGRSVTLSAQITKRAQAGNITLIWRATGGSFDDETADTVTWTSPDDPGVYTISVHATDGQFIGIGTRLIGVGMYAPTVTPYYLGDESCSGCHSGVHSEWLMTGHADAWASLQNSGHPASYCNPCHAIGWEFDLTDTSFVSNAGDGGYDEAPIIKYVNVQCEACHGPGSDHVTSMSADDIQIDWEVMNCGKCHDGTHHPYLTEWLNSPHGFDPYTSSHGAGARNTCGGCHEGVAGAYRLEGDLSVFYGSGVVATRPDTIDVPIEPVNCQTCHNSHSDENPAQLRTVDDVVLIETGGVNPIISEGGTGKLCMQCHHARHGPDEHIPGGDIRFGPHSSPQADVIAAETGYTGVAAPGFNWAGPSHLLVQNSCKTCHLNMIEYPGPAGSAVTGHEFMPTPEACVNCHGQVNDFEDIPAADDFDGNGIVEGLQVEVDGLMDMLREAIVASGLDTSTAGFVGAIGDSSISTLQQREAGWNWVFVNNDQSRGIHNPDYVVQLLQQSILYIGGTLPENAVIVRNDNEVASNW